MTNFMNHLCHFWNLDPNITLFLFIKQRLKVNEVFKDMRVTKNDNRFFIQNLKSNGSTFVLFSWGLLHHLHRFSHSDSFTGMALSLAQSIVCVLIKSYSLPSSKMIELHMNLLKSFST